MLNPPKLPESCLYSPCVRLGDGGGGEDSDRENRCAKPGEKPLSGEPRMSGWLGRACAEEAGGQ